MNPIQIHLLFNHIPVIGSLCALLILSFGLLRKSDPIRKTGLVVLVVSAVFALPTSKSGEAAEEKLEEWPGVSHDLLHEHEEAAELATPLLLLAGGLGLVALFWAQRALLFSVLALGLGLMGFGAMARAAHLGGLIRHPELTQSAPDSGQNEMNPEGSGDRETDD